MENDVKTEQSTDDAEKNENSTEMEHQETTIKDIATDANIECTNSDGPKNNSEKAEQNKDTIAVTMENCVANIITDDAVETAAEALNLLTNGVSTESDSCASNSANSKETVHSGTKSKVQSDIENNYTANGDVKTTSYTLEAQQKLMQKVTSLHGKTKGLREKLGIGWGKLELQQQEVLVTQSEVARRRNDAHAAMTMSKLGAKPPEQTIEKPTTSSAAAARKSSQQTRDNDTSSNGSMELPAQLPTMQFGKQQQPTTTAKREHKKKPRFELEKQLQGMQELLRQLTLQSPQIETKVRQLAHNNPKFQDLELFPRRDSIGTDTPGTAQKQRFDSERSDAGSQYNQQKRDKQRHVSEASNDSVLDSTSRDQATTSTAEESRKKKRSRLRGKKHSGKTKAQRSEHDALTKYLKMIIEDYLGERQSEKFSEYAFKSDEENLESYAQRLVLAGLGRIVEDEIRINRKNNRQSFVTMSTDREGTERDGIILVPVARCYAFEGDIVRAFVLNANSSASSGNAENLDKKKSSMPEETITGGKDHSFCIADDEENPFVDDESPDSDIDPNDLDVSNVGTSDSCPKAFVIAIVKQTDKREVVGTISFKNATKLNDDQNYYKLKPHDMRFPMVYIPVAACEAKITPEQKTDICGFLYVCMVRETDAYGHCIGELDQPVGKVGNLEAEIKAILLHNGLKDVRPFEERFTEMFAEPDAPLSAQELTLREDLRKKCIFTIDPLTARDLDDAMSIDYVSEGIYDIGVHISDVSYYLEEDTELDNIVKDRATSIYLVNEVIHMLPKTLCFKCSLLPGEDKLAFSVFWRMNLKGEMIEKPRFTRSIINSCSQFAYEHAQKIIDNPKESFGVDDFPTICNGFTPADIEARVLLLDRIAKCLREKRYDGGALSINNPKLRFNMDPQSGEPIGYDVDGRQDANFLIEEFMLLANQSVARFVYDHYPNIAILRNHAPPLSKSLKNLKDKLASLGIHFDFSNSKTIYESMQRICASAADPKAMDACLSTLLTKPMARAKYFCSEGKTAEDDLWHYALSIPIYTHFTSPIRRYPDILVHRLLAAALSYCPPPKRTTDELHQMAKVCNDQKFNAKSAGDESTNLFFKRFIKSKQSITLRTVVTEIFQHIINVVTIETGHAISIQYKMQKVLVDTSNVPAYILISEKNSRVPPLKLQMFSTVLVKLVIWDDKICGFFVSPDQKQRQLNSIESSKKKSYEHQQKQQNSTASCSANGNDPSNGVKNTRKKRHSSSRDAYDENSDHSQKNHNKNKTKNENKQKYNKDRVYAVSK